MRVSRSVVSDSRDPMDCRPPGSSVQGILQARVLERVAISFPRERERANGKDGPDPTLTGTNELGDKGGESMSGDEECETMARLQSRVSREPLHSRRHTHPVRTAAPLTTAKAQTQPRCPSTEERIKKTWHVYPRDTTHHGRHGAVSSQRHGWA